MKLVQIYFICMISLSNTSCYFMYAMKFETQQYDTLHAVRYNTASIYLFINRNTYFYCESCYL